jgi:hypothetical protein
MIKSKAGAYPEGRLNTVDLLIRVACFVKKPRKTLNIKMS